MDELIIPAVEESNPYVGADDGALARGMALVPGDSAAWDVFFQRHAPRILGYLKKLGFRQFGLHVCQELFLDTIERVQLSVHGFEYRGGSSFRSWCIAIAHNVFRDYVRHDRPRPVPAHFVPFDDVAAQLLAPEPDDAQPQSAREVVMAAAFEQLPERYQAFLHLSIGCELSDAEIGGALNVPADRVRKLTYRARQALKKKFEALWSARR